jgi:hypothetical protein
MIYTCATSGAGTFHSSRAPEFTAIVIHLYEVLEDINWVIRIRKSKNNRQYNGQKKKYKSTNKDLQNIHIKLEIE